MALTNSQYEELMRMYSRRQIQNHRDLEERRKTAYAKIPALKDLDSRVASEGVARVRSLLSGEAGSAENNSFAEFTSRLAQQRRMLLVSSGFPKDYLDMHYVCSDCQDTGYIEGRRCRCFEEAALKLLTPDSEGFFSGEADFSHFNLLCYPDNMKSPSTGLTSRENMKDILSECRSACENSPEDPFFFFFYGPTGLGKTFLSECMAKEMLSQNLSVLSYSAFDLFDALAAHAFNREAGSGFDPALLKACDLLIIDDLGTELTNSFVQSQLFLLLNSRLKNRKSMIVSTNLSLKGFAGLYSERIFSRISSRFRLMEFYGNDIRIMKKLGTIEQERRFHAASTVPQQ